MGMFSFNANAGENSGQSPQSLERARAIADAMLQQGMDISPIQHPMQGLARIAQALSGNYARAWADKKETAGRKSAGDNFSMIMSALMPQQQAMAQPASFAPSASGGDTFSRMVQIESAGNPNAVSPKGAAGIAQIMPATARDPGFGLPNIFDFAKSRGVKVADNSGATLQSLLSNPDINRGFGEAYFEKMKSLNGGDERLAAAAYNAGPGAVRKAGGVPNIPETQAYVDKLGLNGGPQPQVQPAAATAQPAAVQMASQLPMGQIFELMNNPYLNEAQSGILAAVVKQKLASGEWTKLNDGTLFNNLTGETKKFDVPRPPMEVGPGASVYNPETKQAEFSVPPKPDSPPSAVQEYEYAKSQGFPGTFQDWEASKKGGMSLSVDPATGQVTFQQGSNIKPLTDSQSKDTVFATRAEGALKVFDQIEGGLTGAQGVTGNTVGRLPVVGNFLKSGDYQKAEQAGNEFLQAILRKDTGAAITAGEQVLYGDTYLPRPGNTPEVLAQKKAARTRAVNALKAGMTPQAILAQEQALAKDKQEPQKKRLKFNPETGDLE